MNALEIIVPKPRPTKESGAIASLLVVDDDPDNRELLARRFQREGYHAQAAIDGSDALRRLSDSQFDLVLLDIMMPQISGLDVLAHIRERHTAGELPVIMTTARGQTDVVVKALELGANDYVVKPFDFAVVAARVRTQLSLKQSLAQVVELERKLKLRNADLEAANQLLEEGAQRTRQELEAAAKVQLALLPAAPPPCPQVRCAWIFRPCEQLAGDALNVFPLGSEHIGMYVLDVSGHGVPAALLAVAATRLLSDARDSDSIVLRSAGGLPRPADPAQVAQRLNRKFPWNPATGQFLTLFYAVLHVPTRRLEFVCAGHPGALRIRRDSAVTVLDGGGMPIGVADSFEQETVQLEPGDRLYLYSDGITDVFDAKVELFGLERLRQAIVDSRSIPLAESLESAIRQADRWRNGAPAQDDISILGIECL